MTKRHYVNYQIVVIIRLIYADNIAYKDWQHLRSFASPISVNVDVWYCLRILENLR